MICLLAFFHTHTKIIYISYMLRLHATGTHTRVVQYIQFHRTNMVIMLPFFFGIYTSIHYLIRAMAASSNSMSLDHPLVKRARISLSMIKDICMRFAEACNFNVVLRHREHLRYSSHFSGMGGGEASCFLAENASGLHFRCISQCDKTSQAMNVTCLEEIACFFL